MAWLKAASQGTYFGQILADGLRQVRCRYFGGLCIHFRRLLLGEGAVDGCEFALQPLHLQSRAMLTLLKQLKRSRAIPVPSRCLSALSPSGTIWPHSCLILNHRLQALQPPGLLK